MTDEIPDNSMAVVAPAAAQKDAPAPWQKLALDLGPLLIFFAANAIGGIYVATAVFMVAILAALALQKALHGTVSALPIVTAGLVLFFGGLTLWLQNDTFIKVKPTVLYLIFAGVLAAGLVAQRSLLHMLLGQMLKLNSEGWRLLTFRWIGFFLAMAALNEIVWRLFTTDTWVAFKTFGVLPLTFAFAILQTSLIERHAAGQDEEETRAQQRVNS